MFYAEVQLEAEVLELMAESFSDCSLESLQVKAEKKRKRGGAVFAPMLSFVGTTRCATMPPCLFCTTRRCRSTALHSGEPVAVLVL